MRDLLKSSKLTWIAFSVVLLVGMVGSTLISVPSAHASPTTTPKATCIVHDVHLNGTKPATIRCAQWSTSGSTPTPYTTYDHCTAGSGAKLKITSATTGIYCFTAVDI